MANYFWGGAVSDDIGESGNYLLEDLNATSIVPGVGDVVTFDAQYGMGWYPQTGVSNADWVLVDSGYSGLGGTFNGIVDGMSDTYGTGFFNFVGNGPVSTWLVDTSKGVEPSTFNDDVSIGGVVGFDTWPEGMTFNHRVSFGNGSKWLYSPNSPDVAPASAVLTGYTNLGVPGQATQSASGGGASSDAGLSGGSGGGVSSVAGHHGGN